MKHRILLNLFIITCIVVSIISCKKMLPQAPADNELIEGILPGLTPEQEKNFMAGDELFNKTYSTDEGLGPIFIQNSCGGCHIGDGKGHPFSIETRFGKETTGKIDYMEDKGGPQLQHRSIAGYEAESLPEGYTHLTKRLAPLVVGNGFLAALHDSTLLALTDSLDSDGDGISGRVNYVTPESYFIPENIHIGNNGKYIGRFGKKAKKITLLDQVVFALKQDMGITSDYDTEDIYNPSVGKNSGDEVADPEVSASVVHNLVFYQRTLKAPGRRNENDPDVQDGSKLFENIGCTNCHIPTLKTAVSDIEALSEKEFHPYTDLLLHDMGNALSTSSGYAELPEEDAVSSEWRTQPLWGLGLAKTSQGGTGYYLHDGRATTIAGAIGYHGGEAELIKQSYFNLSKDDQQKIITFLESL